MFDHENLRTLAALVPRGSSVATAINAALRRPRQHLLVKLLALHDESGAAAAGCRISRRARAAIRELAEGPLRSRWDPHVRCAEGSDGSETYTWREPCRGRHFSLYVPAAGLARLDLADDD